MKDSLDILLDNVTEDVTEYEPEFVAHDSLNILRTDVIVVPKEEKKSK